jgi:RimJ/RimL family protein N-acetyltransferase
MSSQKDRLNTAPIRILFSDEHRSLLIRPLEEKDGAVIHSAAQKSKKILIPFLEWAHKRWTKEKQSLRLRKTFKNYHINKEYELGVFSLADGLFLMAASWTTGKSQNRKSLEIGYWTCLDHCRKGLATSITQILIVCAFDFMNCDRIEVRCRPNNAASKRVIERCGFHFEGKIRNYFNPPTQQMINNGFDVERSCLQYALVPEDIKHLDWYLPIRKKTRFISN